jgi:hypothetical protein
MKSILEIIKSIETQKSFVNPTVIYNEGWMTRLLVYSSIQEKINLESIDFSTISNWTSEALISSPFINAQNSREGYTHADIAIGDFTVDYLSRGEIKIKEDASLFGIIEAKMGSNLSKGTTHAKKYNQASRNLVCIAHNTLNKPVCKTFFYVVAPESTIKLHKIEAQIELDAIKDQVNDRFVLHKSEIAIYTLREKILAKIESCEIKAITYEEWISQFTQTSINNELENFYKKAIKWNRIN